ncbi:MAG: PD-(D/E)XK nuclease family transposase [Selenomonas massiliensis]
MWIHRIIEEIPNFEVKSVREMKRLERWLAYFSNKLNETETEALAMSEAAIQEAMKAEYVFMQDEIERWQYEQREKAIRDYISGMRAWRREGLKQGIEQGIKQGIEQASLQNIKSLMKNMNLSDLQAMEILQIPASEQKKYSSMLHC